MWVSLNQSVEVLKNKDWCHYLKNQSLSLFLLSLLLLSLYLWRSHSIILPQHFGLIGKTRKQEYKQIIKPNLEGVAINNEKYYLKNNFQRLDIGKQGLWSPKRKPNVAMPGSPWPCAQRCCLDWGTGKGNLRWGWWSRWARTDQSSGHWRPNLLHSRGISFCLKTPSSSWWHYFSEIIM